MLRGWTILLKIRFVCKVLEKSLINHWPLNVYKVKPCMKLISNFELNTCSRANEFFPAQRWYIIIGQITNTCTTSLLPGQWSYYSLCRFIGSVYNTEIWPVNCKGRFTGEKLSFGGMYYIIFTSCRQFWSNSLVLECAMWFLYLQLIWTDLYNRNILYLSQTYYMSEPQLCRTCVKFAVNILTWTFHHQWILLSRFSKSVDVFINMCPILGWVLP